jgi:hypothetical protein
MGGILWSTWRSVRGIADWLETTGRLDDATVVRARL